MEESKKMMAAVVGKVTGFAVGACSSYTIGRFLGDNMVMSGGYSDFLVKIGTMGISAIISSKVCRQVEEDVVSCFEFVDSVSTALEAGKKEGVDIDDGAVGPEPAVE